jgi:hypothetical protein
MNPVFVVSFIAILLFGIFLDWKVLQEGTFSQRVVYYVIAILALGLLMGRLYNPKLPFPIHFFNQLVSHWVSHVIGI